MNAIYCRVSTDEQATKGYSLDDQKQSCRSHLVAMGLTDINEYIDDGYSGEYLERPALEQLRNDLQAGTIKNIAIYDPDRLSRNLTNQLIIADEIEKSGAKLTFVTGDYDASPEGRLFFSMRGAISAYEKEKIRERTSRGRRAKANRGKIVINTHPFGFSWDKDNSMYIINEREAEIVRLIYNLCIKEKMGARTLALELMSRGVIGRKGKPLSVPTVSRILRKEMYYGTHYLFKQKVHKTGQNSREIKNNPKEFWIPIEVPAIVSRETWDLAQEQIQRNKKLAKRNSKRDYLLRGILYCALCGRSMTAYGRIGKRKIGSGKMYYYYSCISKESNNYAINGDICQCRRIPVDDLEEAVWDVLLKIAKGEKSLNDYLRKQARPNYSQEIEKLHKTRAELEKKRMDITKWYSQNLIDDISAEKELQAIRKHLDAIISNLSQLNNIQEKIKQPGILPADILNAKTYEEKRNILIHFPYQIHAVRQGDSFAFWFKE
ncbi:MAG: recombinase family protein [Veillonellales bacterium]